MTHKQKSFTGGGRRGSFHRGGDSSDDMTDSQEEYWLKKKNNNNNIEKIVNNITKSINKENDTGASIHSEFDDSGSDNQFIFKENSNISNSLGDKDYLIVPIEKEKIKEEQQEDEDRYNRLHENGTGASQHEEADDEYEEGGADDDDSVRGSNDNIIIFTNTDTVVECPEEESSRDRVKRVLRLDAIYLATLLPITYFTFYIPSTYLGDQHALDYYNYYFQWSKYILWISCIIIGFSYVSLVTESRSYPFHCRYQRHRDFYFLIIGLSLMYWISPCRTLMGPNDIDENSNIKSFVYNFFSFVMPYFIGLHYTYLDYNLFLRSVGDKFGTPSLWYTYTFSEVITIIPIVLFIVSLVGWHFYLIIESGLYIYFGIAYLIFFVLLIGVSCTIRKTHYLHLHHYFIFGSMIPLAAFQNPLTAIALGLVTGITVEGCARWSAGWIWYRGVRVL